MRLLKEIRNLVSQMKLVPFTSVHTIRQQCCW